MNKKVKILVSWSGGKDSQACLIWAVKKYGSKNIEAVFCDTGWEHPKTYRHVKFVCEMLKVKLTTLKSKKYDGFIDLSIKRGRVPSTKRRFCTEELKIKPMIDYVLSHRQHVFVIQGIRSDESASRSKMNMECRFFKYYFEPYTTNSMIVEELQEKAKTKELTTTQKAKLTKAINRLKLGKEDPKYHTYRKADILEWCKTYADDVYRPIFNWSAQETIAYSLDNHIPLNPLYYEGNSRVGCYPCIMCTKGEIKGIIERSPETIDKIHDLEQKSGSSFFPPNYVPAKYNRHTDNNSKKYNRIHDVVDYINDKNATGDLFKEIEEEEKESSGRRCMSAYSICE